MSQATLHQRIVSDVEANILSGRWRPGHRLPFEMELAGQYACSRMTVNKALNVLARTGLIERRRKSGSFVARPQSQSAVLEIRDIRSDVVALGLEYAFELLLRKKRRASIADRARLGAENVAMVLELEVRHLAQGKPFCCEQRIIALDTVPEANEESFSKIAPGPWLIERVPWSSAQHVIRAVGADARLAAVLQLNEGEPCLCVERKTMLEGAPVTHVRLVWPAGSHELVAQFEPAGNP
ncbi:MAG TPA: histidine utilization repressor [Rhizobiaceae bacterium]|nr:histidine utilization repressor [Rhizobiaceae bacterium]